MDKKNVHIIAIQEKYLYKIAKQITEVLGDEINLNPITLKELHSNTVNKDDIVVISNKMIKGIVLQLIPKECPWIIAKRDLNFVNAKEIINLPSRKKILVVNDTKTNTDETVDSLRRTIFEHDYIPYNPDESIPHSIDYILTPGEKNLLPSGLTNVIDIGSRLLDIETFYELAYLLGLENVQAQIVKRYIKSLVSLSISIEEVQDSDDKIVNDIRNVARYRFDDVIAVSIPMKETLERSQRYSSLGEPVNIHGDIGTGKSMLAQAIHNASSPEASPFIAINCRSESIDMLEKELFGYEHGDLISMGLFEIAKNGTVYLENINEMHLPLQLKVFKAVKEKAFFRVGGTHPIPFMSRLVTSSKKELSGLVEKGTFLSEFYDVLRLNLKVPSLLERKEDIIPLIHNFKKRLNKSDIAISSEVMEELIRYGWPGNVKELYNVITYLLFLGEDPISVESLPLSIRFIEREGDLTSVIQPEKKIQEMINKIETHGFLDESTEILRIFADGKRERLSFGRITVKKLLENKGITLTEQQLRMRIEVLQQLGLLIVRQGRAGSTISREGEEFLSFLNQYKSRLSPVLRGKG
ncbi:MAG TPA: Fis family transcriptional regulator [Bacillus bacterium]|nr:Fis family transcriptional regulator [Bacillus sp. (in: firmicutes)]